MSKQLMTHLYWGDPNEEFSYELAKTLVSNGADILEIGIPYTDPVCDGEVFQRACERAIAGGMTPPRVIDGIKKLRASKIETPIYLTSYYGPVFKMGVEKFVKAAAGAGVNGLIIPDIVLEEQGELMHSCKTYGLSLIQFATVYSTDKRLKQICEASTDFIYCMSVAGVTGDPTSLKLRPAPDGAGLRGVNRLNELIGKIKKYTNKRVFVGFGISSSEEAQQIFSFGADGIIVGSAIAKRYEESENVGVVSHTLENIATFIRSLNV